jgi:hypothetical protein
MMASLHDLPEPAGDRPTPETAPDDTGTRPAAAPTPDMPRFSSQRRSDEEHAA